jgi:hypothetical protein
MHTAQECPRNSFAFVDAIAQAQATKDEVAYLASPSTCFA